MRDGYLSEGGPAGILPRRSSTCHVLSGPFSPHGVLQFRNRPQDTAGNPFIERAATGRPVSSDHVILGGPLETAEDARQDGDYETAVNPSGYETAGALSMVYQDVLLRRQNQSWRDHSVHSVTPDTKPSGVKPGVTVAR